jgi:large subunit ribosomal protein L25
MEKIELRARPRATLGKRVRFLRRKGIIPANVFGHAITSLAVELDAKAFREAFARAGRNALITLTVDGATEPRLVLIRGIQRRPTTGELLHVDLYQVSLTEKIRTSVPLVFVGSAPGVAAGGVLLESLNAVEVECLPTDLISAIEVDLSGLAEIGDAILVRDLKVQPGITILTHGDELVVKVLPPEKEEVPAAPTEEAVAAAPAAEAKEGVSTPPKKEESKA